MADDYFELDGNQSELFPHSARTLSRLAPARRAAALRGPFQRRGGAARAGTKGGGCDRIDCGTTLSLPGARVAGRGRKRPGGCHLPHRELCGAREEARREQREVRQGVSRRRSGETRRGARGAVRKALYVLHRQAHSRAARIARALREVTTAHERSPPQGSRASPARVRCASQGASFEPGSRRAGPRLLRELGTRSGRRARPARTRVGRTVCAAHARYGPHVSARSSARAASSDWSATPKTFAVLAREGQRPDDARAALSLEPCAEANGHARQSVR